MKHRISLLLSLLFTHVLLAQKTEIVIDINASRGQISPLLYGQFIEYIGNCIDGGLYDEANANADARGFRKDVLEKAKQLQPTLLRFPGGTVVKTFHWEDGIGPKEQRRAKKNLVWGGVISHHFGTCEFIEYCRELGSEPCLVVNMSTGSAEEAANWVEYCNGTGNTYYANLRRSHGYEEPFRVKYWAIGNEEGAEPDAGRHQNPNDYVADAWLYIKLMKLTDPSIKLIANGEEMNSKWNETVLRGIGNAVDYLSYHHYINTDKNQPYSIFKKIESAELELQNLHALIKQHSTDSVSNWSEWYRFPHREQPIKIALDEWGIWERQDPPFGTTNTYTWRHALATASFLNVIQRQADAVGMANWAQLVNILAPIMANDKHAIAQTVFYPLQAYRAFGQKEALAARVQSGAMAADVPALDIAASIDREKNTVSVFVVNRSSDDIQATLKLDYGQFGSAISTSTWSAESLDAKNTLNNPSKDVVKVTSGIKTPVGKSIRFAKESINVCTFQLK